MIRIGTSGWKYRDWEGIVYPKPRPRGFDDLAFLAKYFNTVEINSSYYGAPRPSAARKWVESVADNSMFRFTAKIVHSFTHERKPAPNDEKDFKEGIGPLVEAGRFGALLLQFPWSFRNSAKNREYLSAFIGASVNILWCWRFATPVGWRREFWTCSRNSILAFVISISLCSSDP